MKTKIINKHYFIYDRANNSLVKSEENSDIILYTSQDEAIENLYGNEEVVQFNKLPKDKKNEILKQLKN